MDTESQAEQTRSACAQQCGALRFRPWQRLRGQKAFLRDRNTGVYRHSAAALIRILSPWEAQQTIAAQEGVTPASIDHRWQKQPHRRLGVVASRKVGNAVTRNRAKRIWREIFRLNQHLLPAQCDVLVIVRKDFANAARPDLDTLFADAAQRARQKLK